MYQILEKVLRSSRFFCRRCFFSLSEGIRSGWDFRKGEYQDCTWCWKARDANGIKTLLVTQK